MEKLPSNQIQFIYAKDLSETEYEQFKAWSKGYSGEFHHYTDNAQILIPYNVYETWWEERSNAEMVKRFREMFASSSGR